MQCNSLCIYFPAEIVTSQSRQRCFALHFTATCASILFCLDDQVDIDNEDSVESSKIAGSFRFILRIQNVYMTYHYPMVSCHNIVCAIFSFVCGTLMLEDVTKTLSIFISRCHTISDGYFRIVVLSFLVRRKSFHAT